MGWTAQQVAIIGGTINNVLITGLPAPVNPGDAATKGYVDSAVGSAVLIPPQGRLTLATGIAVMTSSVTGATTVLYTPSGGNQVPIYNGTNFAGTTFTELTNTLSDATKNPAAVTTNSNYDLFVWNDAGTIRLSRGPLWTSNTARNLTLTSTLGILTNTSSITNGPGANLGTYVGTIRTNSTSTVDYIVGGSASGGVAASFGVWNMYNRNLAIGQSVDSGASYTYTSGTVRQARASAGNQVSFVVGLNVDAINISYQQRLDTTVTLGSLAIIGIGEDTIVAFSSQRAFVRQTGATASATTALFCPYVSMIKVPALGYHTYSANEASDGSDANTYDADGTATLTGQVWN